MLSSTFSVGWINTSRQHHPLSAYYWSLMRAASRLLYTSSFLLSRSGPAMSTTALPSSKIIPIDVVSDTVWPWCYIGKRRLDLALADAKTRFPQLSFDVRWRPFEVWCAICMLHAIYLVNHLFGTLQNCLNVDNMGYNSSHIVFLLLTSTMLSNVTFS